jgi:hypothetical protein
MPIFLRIARASWRNCRSLCIGKTTRRISVLCVALYLVFLGTNMAYADVVTSLSDATNYSFGSAGLFGAGPVTVAPGITWSSTWSGSTYGYVGDYGFAANGSWNNFSMIGLNANEGTMTIQFGTPVAGVGTYLDYAVCPTCGDPANIAVYDSSHTLIESYVLTFSTVSEQVQGMVNPGQFLGFLESSADITYLELSNATLGAHDLSVITNVPEPPPLLLLATGAALLLVFKSNISRNVIRVSASATSDLGS